MARQTIKTLRELRVEAGLTLPALAELAGLGKGELSKIERGRQVANTAELEALGRALGNGSLENRMQVVRVDEVSA